MGKVEGSTSMDGAGLEQGLLPEPEWKPGKQEYAVMITLAVISLMVALDATILVSVLPTLAVDLGGSSTDAFWAGTSYLLASAVCQPFIAALSDIFGRKETLITSIVLFTLGTLLCAPVAKDFTVFFVGRAIQGIGGGGIITMGQVIFADIVPLRQRPKYFSIVLAAWALGSVLGPLIGGLFVEHATWAWCFYINFPFCAMGLVLVPIYVKLTTIKSSLVSKLSRVDWVGGFFFIGGMTSFLVGISWGGVQYEWASAQTIAPIIVGVFSIVISVLWEIYYAREPFLRPRLFNSPSALATYASAMFQGFILFCTLYYVPFYFTAIKFETPTQTGLNIFPVTFLLLPGSIVISLLTTRTGRYRWAIWSGWVVTAIGCGLLVLLDADTTTPVWVVILAIFGIGNGILLTAVNVGIQAVSRVEDAGRAAAMYAFMRGLGMSIGVAVGGTVFQNVMSSKLGELGLPKSIAPNSEAFVHELSRMDPADPTRLAAIEAYLAGFHGVYWTITAAAIASFLISLVIKRHSMDKSLASGYTLKGARAPVAPGMAPTPNGSSEMMSAGNHLLPTNKNSLFGSSTRSGSEETVRGYSATKHSYGVQARDGEGSDSGAEATESDAIVAYYIQPGGRIVPVDILPDSQPSSEASSIFREDHWNTHYYGAAGVVVGNNAHHHPSPAELWREQAQATGRLQSESGEHEAAGGNLPPVWMHGR
ncbi:major facilitator superfamily domain-containing protein [Parachaetomium inaequale]|uniref:Major facilitator superfamily domain-containing protein n=1 Tax=Parachaetomium inaequale TaxID=2588326 RepID=A0AAN6PLQ1_9PEZI|nr:major facilitator superfamily domain-containing protein [Parachaetomium inaequale]